MEKRITIGKNEKYPLSGILSLPADSAARVPAVLLVHGSGPNDMDETVFANKPFRDIAEYLPSKGIAVARYDKRLFTYGKQMVKAKDFGSSITVKEEVIEDAVFAANLLRQDSRIDPNRIYVLGHSLGGMLAPRIDAEGGNFAGLILFGSSPRALTDILLDQQDEMLGQSGILLRAILKRYFAPMRKKIAAMDSMTEAEAKKTKMIGSVSLWYFKEMAEHQAADYLTPLEKPVLILQGEKDSHVTVEKDFALYQELCAGKQNVRFKLYPELNHLFMKSVYGNIRDLKREYKIPQKIDPTVMDNIAEFILGSS